MKNKTLTFSSWAKKALKDPELKKEYDKLKPEMAVVRAMIEARIKKGLTQKELAKKIGTTQSVVSRLESGRGNPTLAFLHKIAQAFDARLEVKFL
ncbi:MAG TPA: helix-turn-helix transcriptional regulator [Patescibacteria group bacterium]